MDDSRQRDLADGLVGAGIDLQDRLVLARGGVESLAVRREGQAHRVAPTVDEPPHDRPLGDVDHRHVSRRLARDVEQLAVAGEDRVGGPGRDGHPPVDLLRLEIIEDDLVGARVARPVEDEQMAPVRREGEVVGIAPDPHARDELARLGVDHPQIVALVVDDPRGPAVRVEDDPVGLALAEGDRAHDLEGVGIDDRGRFGLGVGDEKRRPRCRLGATQDRGQEQKHHESRHGCPRFLVCHRVAILWIAVTAMVGGTPRNVNRTASPTETAS